MILKVVNILRAINEVAPFYLAEEWDNSGLQIGHYDWPVKKIWIALDPLPEVIYLACQNNVNLLITHHPLFFKPFNIIDFSKPLGQIIELATLHKLAIISVHTNLDSAQGGLCDVFAEYIGITNTSILSKPIEEKKYKFVVYVPLEAEEKVLSAFFKTKLGKIENYTSCSFRNIGKGTFLPNDKSTPYIGKIGEFSNVDELRIEIIVKQDEIKILLDEIKKVHPYETVAYDIYPLMSSNELGGLGRIGHLSQAMTLINIASHIKNIFKLSSVKVSGNKDLLVSKAAICPGSGSSLIKKFFNSDAQVFITGDLNYHNARDAEALNKGLIDIGHFGSEYIVVEFLENKLKTILSEMGANVIVEACRIEKDPFSVI
ncbi:MAG: Nif3-like dinuclear metal center hexameric protein [Desulfobacterales bacterium]|nr:Nif3-like dinuclear metal center hexameric protein [Desulfobacterales bacterium]